MSPEDAYRAYIALYNHFMRSSFDNIIDAAKAASAVSAAALAYREACAQEESNAASM